MHKLKMAERKRNDKAEWEKFNKQMKLRRTERKGSCSDDINKNGDNVNKILKTKEMIVQPLEGEPSGKAKKYERTGPHEFVPFNFDEVTIDNINEACNQHFADRMLTGMDCDVLATDRRPSCCRTDQLPSLKLINVRFKKKVTQSSSVLSSSTVATPTSALTRPFASIVNVGRNGSESSSLLVIPFKKKESAHAKSISVSKMIRLGAVVKTIQKKKDSG